MTRYAVQITRTYEVQADDEDAAEEQAHALEYTAPCIPVVVVTDLDVIGKLGGALPP